MQISRFYTKNKYIYVICKTLPVTAVNRILLAFYCCWNRAHLWKTALKQNIDFEGLNTWHRGNRKSLWYLLWREFVARTQKSGLFQEPLPRALFDLPWRSWVGSDLNNKAAPCTADESSSFIVGLAATAAGKRRRNEPGTQSQKLWLGPGCVALSGRRDGRLSARARTIIQTWQRGSQPLNCESGSCSSRCSVLRVRSLIRTRWFRKQKRRLCNNARIY